MTSAVMLAGLTMLMAAAPATAARRPKPAPVTAPVPPPPSVKQGVELWRAGDYPAAVAMWQPFANAGDADAMFNIGQAHKLGRAVTKDPAVARDWYRRAAMKGHLPAQANLGILLFQAGDKAEAVRWLKAAADKNEMRAQYVLGVANWNGDGTPRNLTLAYAYLTRASAQGLAEATGALGNLSTMLSPLERANGWAVSTSLAAGTGVPPAFAGPPILSASNDAIRRDQAIKPAPRLERGRATSVDTGQPVNRPNAVQVVTAPAPAPVAAPEVVAAAEVPKPVAAPPNPASALETSAPRPAAPPVSTVAVPPAASQIPVATPPKAPDAPKKPVAVAAVTKPKPSGWRVQLGAFSKKTLAEAAWTEVKTKQKQLVAKNQPIFTADGSVTKLQMGPFASKAAARDACAKIAFSGRACFVTEGP